MQVRSRVTDRAISWLLVRGCIGVQRWGWSVCSYTDSMQNCIHYFLRDLIGCLEMEYFSMEFGAALEVARAGPPVARLGLLAWSKPNPKRKVKNLKQSVNNSEQTLNKYK